MAVVKCKVIKYSVDRVIDYVADKKHNGKKISPWEFQKDFEKCIVEHDEKTRSGKPVSHDNDREMFIHTHNCTYETAASEWAYTMRKTPYDLSGTERERLGYHVIQSFRPGEVTAEEAFEIGKEFADKLFGGKYQYIVTTHLNTDCYHNHIAVCSVSYTDHKKLDYKYYNTPDPTLKRWREVSDEICAARGLEQTPSHKNHNRDTRDWSENTSWRDILRGDIDSVIDECESFDELLDKLEQMGYTIKKTEKNIAFKHKDQEKNPHSRFLRMSSLGRDYTEEDLRERIITRRRTIPKWMRRREREFKLIIEIETGIRYRASEGDINRLKIYNLQQVAASMNYLVEHKLGSFEARDKYMAELKTKRAEAAERLNEAKDIDSRIYELTDKLDALKNYNSIKKYALEYNSSGDKQKYAADHYMEIEQFKVLHERMKREYPEGELPAEEELQAELERMKKERDRLYTEYAEAEEEYDTCEAAIHNIDVFLNRNKKDNEQGDEDRNADRHEPQPEKGQEI